MCPSGSFLVLGSYGVGKMEIAKAVAHYCYGDASQIIQKIKIFSHRLKKIDLAEKFYLQGKGIHLLRYLFKVTLEEI